MRTRLGLLAIALTAALLVLPGTSAGAGAATSHITGTLTGPDGPLEGAFVEVYSMADDSDQEPDFFAGADADGHYDLAVPAGDYRLLFQEEGFDSATLQPEWYDDVTPVTKAKTVHVGSGTTVSGIDALLEPFSAIAGRVTDLDGTPLIASVRVSDPHVYEDDTTTGADGRFELARLLRGKYFVTVCAKGYACEMYDNAPNGEEAKRVVLDAGKVATLKDIRLAKKLTIIKKPTLVGRAEVGRRLVLKPGKYSPKDVKVSVRWFAGDRLIRGESNGALVLTATYVGQKIRAEVTVKKRGYRKLVVRTKWSAPVTR